MREIGEDARTFSLGCHLYKTIFEGIIASESQSDIIRFISSPSLPIVVLAPLVVYLIKMYYRRSRRGGRTEIGSRFSLGLGKPSPSLADSPTSQRARMGTLVIIR